MPGSDIDEVEADPGEEARKVAAWREKQMLEACDGDQAVTLKLLIAGADYHAILRARNAGLPVSRLVEFYG